MKKALALVLALTMTLGMAACGTTASSAPASGSAAAGPVRRLSGPAAAGKPPHHSLAAGKDVPGICGPSPGRCAAPGAPRHRRRRGPDPLPGRQAGGDGHGL